MKRIVPAFLLVFALLFVQAGALAHAASHGEGLIADHACELCVGYAQVAKGTPLPQGLDLPVCQARQQVPETAVWRFSGCTVFSSHARAPPALPA